MGRGSDVRHGIYAIPPHRALYRRRESQPHTEAVRGEGGRLVDKDSVRFMPNYDSRGELAPRDVVSQAIVTQMEKTRHPCVYLDVTHLDAQATRKRFPGIAAACKQFGIDITRDRIPVRPGARYMIGGAVVDSEGRTSIPGLWAAGEVTSSGLHGEGIAWRRIVC